MRSLKKILALALALLMVIGMFSGVSAVTINDYDDVDEIADQYKVAAGVMTGMGIIEGHADGTFAPENTVTRADMAKLIYVMTFGNTNISTIGTGNVFDDVAADHWAANYIEWAAGTGLIVGHGDGTFAPDREITIADTAVLVLRALGYGQQGEYQGVGYDSKGITDANNYGLLKVINNDEFAITDPCQRQVAAQMIYNAMGINIVQYTPAFGYIGASNGTYGTYGENVFNYVVADQPAGSEAMVMGLAKNGKVDIGTELVDDGTGTLVPEPVTYTYAPSTNEVGRIVDVYASEDGVVYYLDVLSEDLEVEAYTDDDDLEELLDADFSGAYNVEEFPNYEANGQIDISSGRAPELEEQDAIYVMYNDEAVSVVYVNKYVYDLTVTEDDDDEEETVITLIDNVNVDASGDPTTEVVDKKNIVNNSSIDLDTASKTTYHVNVQIIGGVYTISDLETVTSAVTSYNASTLTLAAGTYAYRFDSSNAPVDTNDYSSINDDDAYYNADYYDDFLASGGAMDYTNEYTYYISGVTGNIIAVEQPENLKPVTGVAYLRYASRATDANGVDTDTVSLIFADGTQAVVAASADYSGSSTGSIQLPNGVYEYSAVEGVYTLGTAVSDNQVDNVADSIDFTTARQVLANTTYLVTDDTQFVYITGTGTAVTTQTGFHNAYLPEGTDYYLVANNGNIETIFIMSAFIAGPTDVSGYYYYDGVNTSGNASGGREIITLQNVADGNDLTIYIETALVPVQGIYTVKEGAYYSLVTDQNAVNLTGVTVSTPVGGYYTINGTYQVDPTTVIYDATGANRTAVDNGDAIYVLASGGNADVIVLV